MQFDFERTRCSRRRDLKQTSGNYASVTDLASSCGEPAAIRPSTSQALTLCVSVEFRHAIALPFAVMELHPTYGRAITLAIRLAKPFV